MRNKIFSLTLAVTMLATGCEKQEEKTIQTEQPKESPTPGDIIVKRSQDSTASSGSAAKGSDTYTSNFTLSDTWVSDCLTDGEISEQLTWAFNKQYWMKQSVVFDATDCDLPNVLMVTRISGPYKVGADSSVIKDAKFFNATLQHASMTLYTEEYIDAFNEVKNYGYSDWSAGVEKSIISRVYYDANNEGRMIKPGNLYALFLQKDDAIIFSEFALSEDKRPDNLDEELVYVRR